MACIPAPMAKFPRFCYYDGLFPYIGLHLPLTGRVSRPCVPCSLLSLWDSAGAKWDSAGAKWDSAGLCAGVVHVPPARRRGAGEEGEGADVRPKLRQKLPKLSETFPETSPPNLHSLSVCAAHARSGAECLWKGGEGGQRA